MVCSLKFFHLDKLRAMIKGLAVHALDIILPDEFG